MGGISFEIAREIDRVGWMNSVIKRYYCFSWKKFALVLNQSYRRENNNWCTCLFASPASAPSVVQ